VPSPSKEELVLPFPAERALIGDATHFRSTWLTSSIATLRERGHFDRYASILDPEHKDKLLNAVPGQWFPMATARAHYGACDGLGLSNDEMLELGKIATRKANATTIAFVLRLAKGAGVTPWTIIAQLQRIFTSTCMGGGGAAVWKLGPKEARAEIVGFPLAELRYNRVTMRGILEAILERFCTKVYVVELPKLCSKRELGFRLSWA
jgi:hypothetical protein